MRHLINTYIQADPADLLGDLSSMSLTELIIETGIHDAMPESSMRRASFQRTPLPRHHQQRPQDHHLRPADRPQVLRTDEQAAGRSDSAAT
jgi:hypothetical protein